jgi:primosomal protein N' (replication factor Y) (superfamily II helicase)
VVVPFGTIKKVGVVVGRALRSELPAAKLKSIDRIVEDVPPIGARELSLLKFCAMYYQRPLGEVLHASLPPRLRQVRRRTIDAAVRIANGARDAPPGLSAQQGDVIEKTVQGFGRFHPVLLFGITGSGKTEVYLRLIEAALARGSQALLLVPEIGLTPQLEARVRGRFPDVAIVSAHSHLGEGERAVAWLAAQSGEARIVLGTRLAVLMPFANLGLIVVDEENDASYKQHEGLRYSARDVAVQRAQMLAIPVVLGSATPSLESWSNARQERYVLAALPSRAAAGAALPRVRMLDTRTDVPREGLAAGLLDAMRARLARGEQSLVFVNRRGYSPVLYCRACAWHSTCTRCSANLVLHLKAGELRCHHCGHREKTPAHCPSCGAADIAPVGHGTQRLEQALADALPGARIARVDRDSTARKGSLGKVLDQVREDKLDVLVGTQMLAKGHDYPRLTLVGVVGSDSALFSADFRAAERLYALITQVAGRAGRAERAGEVIVQTDFPDHPLYAAVAAHDFAEFADAALEERRVAGFPPFAHFALLRAESKATGAALAFLRTAARLGNGLDRRVEIFDPVPATLERKAGFERAQLLVRAKARSAMQHFLRDWKTALDEHDERRVRWSLDVDPQDV